MENQLQLILTIIASGISVAGFIYAILRNFKNDMNSRMHMFEHKITSIEERMFWLSTGKSLAEAILEERMKK